MTKLRARCVLRCGLAWVCGCCGGHTHGYPYNLTHTDDCPMMSHIETGGGARPG